MFSRTKQLVLPAIFATLTVGITSSAADESKGDRFISRTRQLTHVGRRAGEGYFSPDGKRMILQSERHPQNPFFQIYVVNLETGASHRVSTGEGRTTCAFFRPGTDEVLFASSHRDPHVRETQAKEYRERQNPTGPRKRWEYDKYFDIYVADSHGENLRRITATLGYDAEASFSPDGKRIAFSSNRFAYPIKFLKPEARAAFDRDPSFFCELMIMDADGENDSQITSWDGNDGGPFFTPDGERIIWRHFNETGTRADIYTIKTDGTDRRRLTKFMCMSWAPYMHPSGEYAIFTANKLGMHNFELYLVDALGEKEPTRVTYTDGFDGLPVFAPDGKTLSWTTSRSSSESGIAQIFIADWDHAAALAAVAAAPSRGTPQPDTAFTPLPNSGWPWAGPPKDRASSPNPKITRDDLYGHVNYLAGDELEGRMTGTKGAALAGEYIAAKFAEAGLQPFGDDGTWFQKFSFPANVAIAPEKNSLSYLTAPSATAPMALKLDEGFRPLSFAANQTAEGGLVFAGYGLVVPEDKSKPKYDSYEGLDVKGKIVMVLDDVPGKLPTEERVRLSLYSSPRYKAMQAKQRGAIGFLLVAGPNTPGGGKLAPVSRNSGDAGIAAASLTIPAADALLAPTGQTLATLQTLLDDGKPPVEAKANTAQIAVRLVTALDRKQGECRNVVGLLPPVGNSPFGDAYVVVGAHYDHIGHGEAGGSLARPDELGQIHNGADDNASGSAAVLELAAAMVDARKHNPDKPQRGIIFACWSGEEIGVLGSDHFVKQAAAVKQAKAYVNFDMVGRLRHGRLIVQGAGSSADWRPLLETACIREPLALNIQDDPYLPTDSTPFYIAGVPVLAFFTDVHEDYNRPTDDADTLNYAGMEQITRFAQHVVSDLAERDTPLSYVEVERSAPPGGGGGRRLYTGMIPDFSASKVAGMKVGGAKAGSPAGDAGVKAGDVIIRFAGQEIRGLQDYANVLGVVKPDQPVELVVLRDDKEVKLTITPTLRK